MIEMALWGVLLPSVVTGVVLLALRPWRENVPEGASLVVGPAVFAGFVAGYVGLFGAPEVIPIYSKDWLPHLALLGVLGCVSDGVVGSGPARWISRVLMASLAAWLIARLHPSLDAGETVGVVAAIAAGLLVHWEL